MAKGLSDSLEAKKGTIGANTYLVNESVLSDEISIVEVNDEVSFDNGNIGSYEVTLKEKEDHVTYLIDVDEEAFYGLYMYLKPEYANKQIGIQIDDATPFLINIPDIKEGTSYVSTLISEFQIPKGIHKIKFINASDEFGFNYFELLKSSKHTPLFENDLSTYVSEGAEYVTTWKLKDDGHYAIAGNRQLLYFGDDTITDFTLEVDVLLEGETSSSSAGIIIHAGDVGLSSQDNYDSLVGYYIGLNNNRVFLNKYNYNLSEYNLGVDTNTRLASGEYNTLKVVSRSNEITVFVNDKELFSYDDSNAFHSGRIGLYTEGAAIIYKNLKISEK